MTVYPTNRRIDRATVRSLASSMSSLPREVTLPWAPAAEFIELSVACRDQVGDVLAAAAGRWAAFREVWRQLTFVLLDPESWR